MIKYKQTNKLFYDQWNYKVSFALEGASYLRNYPLEHILEKLEKLEIKYRWHEAVHKNKAHLIKLAEYLKDVDKSLFLMRVESGILDLYTNDSAMVDTFVKLLPESFIRFVCVPSGQVLNKKSILVSKYPDDRFTMRVYLKPHKLKDGREKEKFVSWVKNQPGISMSEAVEDWFIRTEWNWDRRYVLVDNEKTLLMLKLRNSDVVGSVYQLVLNKLIIS